jgi:DNA-binding XRE family transcriptional regulator
MDDAKYSLVDLRRMELLTQAELADELGVTQQMVSDWENEHYTPSMKNRRKIANHFKKIATAFIRWPKE